MATKPKRPRDTNQLAKFIVDLSTSEVAEPKESVRAAAGRLGGQKGGKTRMAALSEAQRSEMAKQAAAKRWGKTAPPTGRARTKST